jgi:hypothetical protein
VKRLDERYQVRKAIENFPRMWGEGSYPADVRGRMVGAELKALDPETATAAQVNEIIGNEVWAYPMACNECGAETWDLVEVGEPDDHDSRTARLCEGCLLAGARLARGLS